MASKRDIETGRGPSTDCLNAPLSDDAVGNYAAQAKIQGRFSYEPPHRKPYPCLVGIVRRHIFKIFVLSVFLGTMVYLGVDFFALMMNPSVQFIKHCKNVSVPLVCLLFTWFHVWLALKMVFYPIKFYGCGKEAIIPSWLGLPINGWQGIIPNRIEKMSRRACDVMIGNIVTIEEFMDRMKPDHFFEQLQDMLGSITSEVMERIVLKRWPTAWEALPASVKAEIKEKVLEDIGKTVEPTMRELKVNINSILSIKEMSVEALVSDPQMMVDIFEGTGARELTFIQHVAAVMGFLLGVVQLIIYMNTTGTSTDYIMLPVSGLIIGYFTNWLALKMTFAPVWPHMMFGGYINVQGVLLKRQKEAAAKMAELICEKVVDARAMLQYIAKSNPTGLDTVLAIYTRHLEGTIDGSLGFARGLLPTSVGQGVDDIKKDIVDISLELLPKHTESIERYMDDTMKVQETLSWRLQRIPRGILGVIIGLVQAWVLNI